MAYPTFSQYSILSISFELENNVISSPLDAGYELRRPRFTRSRKTISVDYEILSTSDKEALLTHYNTVGLATSFTFTDVNNNSYTVYFTQPLKYKEVMPGWWKFETIVFREV